MTPNGAVDNPVTITATSYNVAGRSGGDQLAKFTELVSTLSNGSITITAGPQPDSARPDTSAEAMAMTQDGGAQLAVVSARTFDTLGVTSFQALQAPYLITSNELADKVLADPIADTMLEGTKTLGLVGLGMAYDFLAYPGGYDAPVLTPDDYKGEAFQVRPSRANDLLVQALGGVSDPSNGPDLEQAVANGEIRGSWSTFDEVSLPAGEIFTANEPVFFRANVIVMNDKVFAGLSPTQQQALRDAAAQTRDWMATTHKDPAVLAASYCSDLQGSIAIATPDQLDAMKAATASVVDALEQEDVTRSVIARIRELAAETAPAVRPNACQSSDTTVPMPTLAAKGDQSAIDGVWRLEVDPQILIEEGGQTQLEAGNNAGVWTFTFNNGKASYQEPRGRQCQITYVLNGKRFLGVGYDPGCDNVFPLVMDRSGNTLAVMPWPNATTGIPLTGEEEGRVSPDPPGFTGAFFHNSLELVGEAN